MITLEKLAIFQHYYGDVNHWARSGSKKEQSLMDDKDWSLIDSLLQDLSLVESGLTSEQYKNSFEKKMSQEGVDQAIKSKLIELIRKM